MNKKIEDLKIGQKYINSLTGLESTITAITSNSVELFNLPDLNSKVDGKKKDDDGEIIGKLRGIKSKQYYTLDQFNKQFS
jgi:hypothetical protein